MKILNFVSGWQFTNSQKRKFGLSKRGGNAKKFPLCQEEERNGHVFICSSVKMRKVGKVGWRRLSTNMKLYSDLVIIEKIWFRFHSITESHTPDYGPCCDSFME